MFTDTIIESLALEGSASELLSSTSTYRTIDRKSINIQNLQMVRLGSKLLCNANALNSENKLYTMYIIFNLTNDKKPNRVDSDIKVRCSCPDFIYRFGDSDYKSKYLYGRAFPKYERVPGSNRPPVNPTNTPGMCKHLIAFLDMLHERNIIE